MIRRRNVSVASIRTVRKPLGKGPDGFGSVRAKGYEGHGAVAVVLAPSGSSFVARPARDQHPSWPVNHGVVTLAWAAVLAMLFGARRSSGVLAIATLLPAAAAYCRSAKHDESYGYPCTAAVEWRKAAELLAPVPALADRCWCEWERLMQISRRLAGPVEGREFLTTDFWLRRPALEAGRKA